MGLFNAMKNLLFEEERRKQLEQQVDQIDKPSQEVETPIEDTDQVEEIPPQCDTKVDDQVYKQFSHSLQEAMEAENLPGFDLFEFHQIFCQEILSGKTTNQAFSEAFRSSITMRISKQSLIENYDHYKRILDEQKQSFQKDLEKFYDHNIKEPKARQDVIDQELNEKLEQLEKLNVEIEGLKEKKRSLGFDTNSAIDQMTKLKETFDQAYKDLTGQLNEIIDNLKKL